MRRTSYLFAAVAALMLVLAPNLADARAGRGFSFGSRGTHTWSAPPRTNAAPFSAAPVQRSFTQPSSPSFAPSRGFGYRTHSPFMSGLLGGLIGAGIGGMLFGHGMFGGIHGTFGFLGLLLQIFLIVVIVRWLWRRFVAPQPSFAGMPGGFARDMGRTSMGPVPMGGGQPGPAGQPLAIGPQDFQAFEQILKDMQAAWSARDLESLRRLTTPEMLIYFAEQLAEQQSRGVHNVVTDVRLEKGDLSEAWTEPGRDYATVAMVFSMIDVTQDASGRIVDGSPVERVSATEFWTFLRAPGGRWLLSAVQQAR